VLKKDITFENFDGVQVTEVHYFHIYEAELVEFLILHNIDGDVQNGLKILLDDLIKKNDRAAILALFKELVVMGYGQRNPERPEKFLKTPEVLEDFKSSPAYKALYLELMTSEKAAANFLLGAIPRSMSSNPKVASAVAASYSGTNGQSETPKVPDPNGLDSSTGTWPRDPQAEVQDVNMPDDTKAWPADNGPQPEDGASYLTNPRDSDGSLVPWAFREPSNAELKMMSKPQMMDVFRRKSTDWEPYQIRV
jgi:hypothetical protein